jgi:peptidoglycan L-alanyl-D-glutamate endopeptidase CwlK
MTTNIGIHKGAEKLKGLHPDLVKVITRAAQLTSFTITEGLRTLEKQREYVADGKSKTLNSRHIPAQNGYGHAIDIYPVVNGRIIMDWSGGHFAALAKAVKRAAKEAGVPIEWGGDWRSFKDGPHWELSWKAYPKGK